MNPTIIGLVFPLCIISRCETRSPRINESEKIQGQFGESRKDEKEKEKSKDKHEKIADGQSRQGWMSLLA